jgi:diketogulonate reductase-like aldo/keto reductase
MRYVTLQNAEKLPVIGLGTWSIGGGMAPARSRDEQALQALHTALDLGYTHLDTAEMYGAGHTEELIGRAIQGRDRKEFLLTTKVSASNLRYADVLRALDRSLARLKTSFVDLYLIHWPNTSIPLEETFKALNQAVREQKVRHVGVSNFNLEQLQKSAVLCETPLTTNQVPYSLFTRRYQQNGIIKYCQQNQIVVTAYSPLKDSRLGRDATVQQIANNHRATSYQIGLAWLVQQPWVITIPMSENPQHLAANLKAGDLQLTPEEMEVLDRLG